MAEEYDEDYEATPQEKRDIARYFIMSSPIGEVKQVCEDVKILVSDSGVLGDEHLTTMLREYNLKKLTSAKAPDGSQVLVSSFGEVDETTYIDPATGKVLKFDHLGQKWTEETEQKQMLDPATEAIKAELHKAMTEYMNTQYSEGKWTLAVYADDEKQINICISAKNVRLRSFWTGGWLSTFSVNVNNPGEATLSGEVTLNVHYYEDGNVQLNSNISKEAPVTVGDPASTAASIANAVRQIESTYHENLEKLYVDLHGNAFKAMRRFWPMNKQPMNWISAAHKLANEITK